MITLWFELLWVYVGLVTLALPSNLFPRWATKVIWKKANKVKGPAVQTDDGASWISLRFWKQVLEER